MLDMNNPPPGPKQEALASPFLRFTRDEWAQLRADTQLTLTIEDLRKRHVVFRGLMDRLLQEHDFLMLPCAPMTTLAVGADHSATRVKILRYTSPISLAGMPAVTLPAKGGGVQLVAARGNDARLLAFAASLGEKIALQQ